MLREAPGTTFTVLKIDGRYVSADNLRFACVLAIITVHASNLLAVSDPKDTKARLFQLAAVSLVKFGTIGFFLISGFLLEKNLQTQSSLSLMRKRIRKVLLPWTFWFLVTCLALSATDLFHHKRAFLKGTPLVVSIWKTSFHTFTSTAFWFVPNLLLSLTFLLVFRRYLHSLLFGAMLLATSLFYSVNIYTQWIEVPHTRALFGFIFYLWLGHYAGVSIQRFSNLLRSIPSGLLWLGTSIAALAQVGEGWLLLRLHSVDPLNTLKVTTQVFSVLVFLCFFKHQRSIWPKFIDVSRTTFGMYLSHVLILSGFNSALWTLLISPVAHPLLGSLAGRVTLWLAVTALTSGASLMLSRGISNSQTLSWIVGSPKRIAAPQGAEHQGQSTTSRHRLAAHT
jgi:membrane-bound acyltransferase YfiQ involved in biofilm formation